MGLEISSLLPFGLLELDATGTIIRYSPALEESPPVPVQEVLGRNFFTDFMPNGKVQELRARFQLFMAHGMNIDRFASTFPTDGGPVKVQILLARLNERSDHGIERLALVRIMPDSD